MRPTLFTIGGGDVRTYGVAMALAFLVAVVLGARAAKRRAVGVSLWLDLCFWLLVSGVLGSRLLFVITNADAFYQQCAVGVSGAGSRSLWRVLIDCSRPLHVWEGGLVYYGGVIAATLTTVYYLRKRGASFLRVADLAAPLLALGHAIGRLGCLAAGCCYGKVALSGAGARFPRESLVFMELVQRRLLDAGAQMTPALHATQLYEALGEGLIFLALTLLTARRRYHGQIFIAYLLLYGLLRSVVEVFRDDPLRRFVFELYTPALNKSLGVGPGALLLSTSQAISLLMFVAAGVLWWKLRRARGGAAGA
ncbi:MAG: prolipoprotein diacylglyceryl transferase [Myxococcales bacterium]|nr:prolipoprotein diacylglyceryl transferase [Myxococcales bacterium]